MLRIAGRFRTASAALACVGNLVAAHRDDKATFHRSADAWWVSTTVELDLGRIAVQTSDGVSHVDIGGWLVPDRGFGPAPQARTERAVDMASLSDVALLDLIRAAGLHPDPPRPLSEASVLVPGFTAAAVLRRAIDLNLTTHYRPARLTPLFAGDADETTTLVQIDLRALQGSIPPTLLGALAELPLTLVARRVGDGPALLIQHRLASPLSDELLAMLAAGESWVLADAAFGCWRLDGLADPLPGAGLVRTERDFQLVDQRPGGADVSVSPTPVKLIPKGAGGQPVDAMLLDDADLANLALLLEGHPLADVALLLRGHDRHLVTAPGGLLEDFPTGEPLACIGPHLLYVPLGYRLAPRLPPTARQQLFSPDAHHAVVLHAGGGAWRFAVSGAAPVWHLWADPNPTIADQLPADTMRALAALESQPAAAPKQHRGEWPRPDAARPAGDAWRAEAWALETAGDFAKAAALYRQNRDPLRAAHLYERAALLEQPNRRDRQ